MVRHRWLSANFAVVCGVQSFTRGQDSKLSKPCAICHRCSNATSRQWQAGAVSNSVRAGGPTKVMSGGLAG